VVNEQSLKSVEELHRLKAAGVITEEEFERAKERVLFGPQVSARQWSGNEASHAWTYPPQEDFIGWLTLPLKRYADFEGRSGRKEFWIFQLLPFAVVLVIIFALAIDTDSFAGPGTIAILTMLAGAVALLGLFIPQLAVQARRFHDQNLSGWYTLLNLIPYVGSIVVFVFMLIPGTAGQNRFGADPREEGSA
jgi:uncharacterized membrane protein YhaH (DUF805 family)